MATSDTWSDFESLRHNVKHNTVDRLKQILSGFNEECGTHFSKSGKKQEIIDRIVGTLDVWKASNFEDKWIKAKGVLYQVRNSGVYTPSRVSASSSNHPPAPITHNPYTTPSTSKPVGYHTTPTGSTTIGRYDPYAPPRKASGSTAAIVSPPSAQKPPAIRFKSSPFFRIEQAVSPVTECPESTSATDRRQQTVTFILSNDQILKLKSVSSNYQLRLFCTSSMFFSPTPNTFRTNTGPCPIEFPPTCEVRVNNVQLTANLKGLKKKPGTAPPPDLGKYVRLTPLQNRVEMVYVNSQQPVQPKKFYLVVMLVEITTVEQLVENLKKAKYRSSHDIRQKMIASMTEDDDIVAGPQKMSLKCPLSFMRVSTPCRSAQCVHSQCFDATSWFSVMEQTTTWLCPVCERVLNCDDLIIDGYFDEILKQSPESVEDVMVEADGEWHTSDNQYASATWRSCHPSSTIAKLPLSPRKSLSALKSPSHTPTKSTTSTANGNSKPKTDDVEIVVLDSDDEDEGRVKRELSPSFGSGSSVSANQSFDGTLVPPSQVDDVIDLTLDSDEEEPAGSTKAGKRKASDAGLTSTSPTEQIWKKGRIDRDLARAVILPGSSNSLNGNGYPRHLPQIPTAARPTAPTSPPAHYTLPYPGNNLPPVYPYISRGGSATSTQLQPPPSNPYLTHPRLNGSSRWP